MLGAPLSAFLLVLLAEPSLAQPTPLSAEQAYKPAAALAAQSIGCGGVDENPRDAGNSWAFDVRVGIGGRLDLTRSIVVNKQTGVAVWASRSAPAEQTP